MAFSPLGTGVPECSFTKCSLPTLPCPEGTFTFESSPTINGIGKATDGSKEDAVAELILTVHAVASGATARAPGLPAHPSRESRLAGAAKPGCPERGSGAKGRLAAPRFAPRVTIAPRTTVSADPS